MKYKIIIPTFKRPECLVKKTLWTLQHTNVFEARPDDYELYIFVANEGELVLYSTYFEKYDIPICKIIVGKRGIPNQRNFIQEYFAEGDWLFMIDDDISKINYFDELPNKSRPLFALHDFLQYAFTTTAKAGLKMWGVNANTSPLNMQNRMSIGLIYLVGNFIGLINTHDKRIYVDEGELIPARSEYRAGKESHERVLKHYETYGGVIKFKHIGVESQYWKEPGGHQVSRTIEGEREASEILLRTYPHLLNYRDMNGVPDIECVRGKTTTYPLDHDFSNRQMTMNDFLNM